MFLNPLAQLPDQLCPGEPDGDVYGGGEVEDLVQDGGDDGVLRLGEDVPAHGRHHEQRGLQLLPLVGRPQLGVHLSEHVAAADYEDAIFD